MIIIGDSTVVDHGIGCDTLIWDPPWDTELVPAGGFDRYTNILAFCDGRRAASVVSKHGPPAWVFVWDCVSSWFTKNRPLQRHKLCLWYGDVSSWRDPPVKLDKRNPFRVVRNSRGICAAGNENGVSMSDVFCYPITNLHRNSGHKHSKPVIWLAYLISGVGATRVYDPCAGSGAAHAACASLGIDCVSVEIDPDVAALIGSMRRPREQSQLSMWTTVERAREDIPARTVTVGEDVPE